MSARGRINASDALGFFLFTITAIYAVEYFASGAASWWDALKAGGMAIGFEVAKIILWRRGWKYRNVLFILVSLPFFCISFIAAGGSAIVYMGKGSAQSIGGNLEVRDIESRIAQTDRTIELLQKRLDTLASDPTAATASLRSELADAQRTRSELSTLLLTKSSTLRSVSSDTVLETLAGIFHIRADAFILYFMLARAILLELGAMASTVPYGAGHGTVQGRGRNDAEYIQAPKFSLSHIIRERSGDSATTYCGLKIKGGHEPTATTPVCKICLDNREHDT